MAFPLPFVPKSSYKSGGRAFGADREGKTRKHAGCDLIATLGTEIFAVDSGTIIRGPYYFYHGTYALEVKHPNFIVRYCEIQKPAEGIGLGSRVEQGQLIAYVGKMRVDSMLHFEMYSGRESGPLTQRNNPPYQRRPDLIDPTPYLDRWVHSVLSCHMIAA